MFYYDPTYILVVIGIVLTLLASAHVNHTYKKYSKINNSIGLTGYGVAIKILQANGLDKVKIERVSGQLTDHYDPTNNTLRLSDSTYNSTSIAAIAVAAHECGHAIQHSVNYKPISIRSHLVPIANIGSQISLPLIIVGMFFNSHTGYTLMMCGVICFALAVLFQVVTLPVEFNASNRALSQIQKLSLLDSNEMYYGEKMLKAAALTYVAGVAASLLQLLRLIIIAKSNDD